MFQRAIDAQNVVVAQAVARELGRITLGEALELCALVARKDPRRRSRYAVRWLQRFLDEVPASVEEVALVASALASLGGAGHDAALAALTAAVPRTRDRVRGEGGTSDEGWRR
ncbi:MAG TPA: hypothetical protein VI408_08780 [Gaiellaceae bacterium]